MNCCLKVEFVPPFGVLGDRVVSEHNILLAGLASKILQVLQ